MDNKKRSYGSANTESLVYWSSSFLRQPARVLIVEALPPWWSNTCPVLCDALDNFLSLACCLDGPCRLPHLSLYSLSRQQECLLPFVQVRGNLARLRSCVEELRSIPSEGCSRGTARGGEMLRQAVLDSLQQFKQYMRHIGANSHTCVEVTVVTGRPGRGVVHFLENGLTDADLVPLKRLLVVQLHTEAECGEDAPSPEASRDASEDNLLLVDLQQVDNNVIAVESVLKAWLQEQGGDKEHLHLLLPSPLENHIPMCIKCDKQERLISPALIPLTPQLGVKTESVRDFMSVSKGATNQSQVPQKLRAIKALRADGMCESMLYGLPLVIRPTTCWQLDWDEMENNHNWFHALCHTLQSRDTFLLLQVESTQRSATGGPAVFSHYVLQPSASLSFLLKPVVSRELLLPCTLSLPVQDPTPEAMQVIQGCFTQMDEECVFNPHSLSSNLYPHLRSRGLLSQPRYPYRLQPATHRQQSQPPEGAKATASRQPRQARQLGMKSKIKATVSPMPFSCSSSLGLPLAKASRPVLTFQSSGSHQAFVSAHQEQCDDSSIINLEED
nr:meiosis 1 arrest protein-like isoform X1 [Nerophis lumbriciformis]XP_061816121.1 meiosis 1 arrest protein-like isoform X1 [Nerophis lumbriciformis]XP_061816122.1 meiosis 1 arrest protein-like isoform X1 [Nerophis lumbriciformis]XP_061816123.1 meiosis 1 arrest protein-like isoform X1 [Nerophis lumbriciformis]XP_061816124.1 meiosis 1 arrest protein-like isoform X1 [Nerophis lumbriciformis]XP_061816125.1 meiosis 1 arrest protein-like isoform X1 [Nerophis lumbriciformis]XP_061816126.1 meiosis 